MSKYRTESDSLGEVQVAADDLWGAQTQRALQNFTISSRTLPPAFIHALIRIKWAAALANKQLDQLDGAIADAICRTCEDLLADAELTKHFPVDVYQTGSGTSTNMNANEVIAHLATQKAQAQINANDHVNCGQSSNDVIPTAIAVAASCEVTHKLLPGLRHLEQVIGEKINELTQQHGNIVKTGRTHLMDAVPITLQQAMGAWSSQIQQHITAIEASSQHRQQVAQGGTAVGTGLNTHPEFAAVFCQQLAQLLDHNFEPAANPFAAIANQDASVQLSGQLKGCAVSLMKMANDLRWMNSGPLTGLGEITLEALQPGSSIMPGKVNPVIPEAVTMAAAQVMGNDTAITIGGQSGNFELNTMLPLVASNLLESITLVSNSAELLADRAVRGFTINEATLSENVARNPILVTALNPVIGYKRAAEIAKKAYADGRPILDVAAEETDIDRYQLEQLLNPERLAFPHGE